MVGYFVIFGLLANFFTKKKKSMILNREVKNCETRVKSKDLIGNNGDFMRPVRIIRLVFFTIFTQKGDHDKQPDLSTVHFNSNHRFRMQSDAGCNNAKCSHSACR